MYTKLISNCYDRIPGPERHHQTRHSYNEGRKLQIRLIWFFRGPRYDVHDREVSDRVGLSECVIFITARY